MGTTSATKVITHASDGSLQEVAALTTSAGAADAHKLPALNAAGVLDPSIVNAVTASAGAGSAGKVAALDGSGRLDSTMMPVGIGADTASIIASEALAAGDFINVWDNAGTANVRKADGNTAGKDAHGFVLASVASGAAATVYFEGANTQCSGLTPGAQFLGTTPGKTQSAPPTGSGKVSQRVGVAISATTINFEAQRPVTLA